MLLGAVRTLPTKKREFLCMKYLFGVKNRRYWPNGGAKWEKFVKSTRQKWTATRGTVVCSKHFTEDCFEYGSDTVEKYKTPRLKKDNLGVCVFPTLATSAETSVESKHTRRAKRRQESKVFICPFTY